MQIFLNGQGTGHVGPEKDGLENAGLADGRDALAVFTLDAVIPAAAIQQRSFDVVAAAKIRAVPVGPLSLSIAALTPLRDGAMATPSASGTARVSLPTLFAASAADAISPDAALPLRALARNVPHRSPVLPPAVPLPEPWKPALEMEPPTAPEKTPESLRPAPLWRVAAPAISGRDVVVRSPESALSASDPEALEFVTISAQAIGSTGDPQMKISAATERRSVSALVAPVTEPTATGDATSSTPPVKGAAHPAAIASAVQVEPSHARGTSDAPPPLVEVATPPTTAQTVSEVPSLHLGKDPRGWGPVQILVHRGPDAAGPAVSTNPAAAYAHTSSMPTGPVKSDPARITPEKTAEPSAPVPTGSKDLPASRSFGESPAFRANFSRPFIPETPALVSIAPPAPGKTAESRPVEMSVLAARSLKIPVPAHLPATQVLTRPDVDEAGVDGEIPGGDDVPSPPRTSVDLPGKSSQHLLHRAPIPLAPPSEARSHPADPSPEVHAERGDGTLSALHDAGDGFRRSHEADPRLPVQPRSVAAQIAEAVRTPSGNAVEVRLSPEELGRVRVSMSPGENGLVVQLVAERPETLDLLRRHVDILAAELRDAGFSDLEFAFRHEGGQSDHASETAEDRYQDPEAGTPQSSDAPHPPLPTLATGSGLDIRL